MYSLAYKIKTLSPVLLAGSGDPVMIETFDHIAGSTVLGVLASIYNEKKGYNVRRSSAHMDNIFYSLFLSGKVIYHYAYMMVRDDVEEIKLLPTPLAVQKDKYHDTHCYNLALTDTDEKTKVLGGYGFISGSTLEVYHPEKQLNFHHYRQSRIKKSDTKDTVFNYESLNAGQEFYGEIYGDISDLELLKDIFGSKFTTRLGRSKNTQYGMAEFIFMDDISLVESDVSLERDEVILTFLSPVILYNDNGFPDISEETLRKYVTDALGTEQFFIEKYYARSEDVEKYINVWGLKKPLERALSAGSSYKIGFGVEISDMLESNINKLVKYGFGERRNEGYGRLAVNWLSEEGYYLEGEKYKKKQFGRERVAKPHGEPPEIVKSIFLSVVDGQVARMVENTAVADVNNIDELNANKLSTSIVGRLELMLKGSGSSQEFRQKLSDLRKTAGDKLKSCQTIKNKETLSMALGVEPSKNNKPKPDLDYLFRKLNDGVDTLSQLSGYDDYLKDSLLREKSYRIYWQTFFKMLRKRLKGVK